MRLPYRLGHGYDVHRFGADRPLILGGVEIPHNTGLVGHSDADALTHALADAILGAIAAPDIGQLFPDTDPAHKDLDSQQILARAVAEAAHHGYVVGNLDATIVTERPKMAPHLPAMRQRLATTCRITPDRVGLKATTHEQMGALGRQEGLAAHAVALLIARAHPELSPRRFPRRRRNA